MVMINASIDDLNSLIKKKLRKSDYEELCFRYGIDVDGDDKNLNFETTSDRVELVSKFSLAALFADMMGLKLHSYGQVRSVRAKIDIKKTHRPEVNLLLLKMKQPIGENLSELLVIQEKLDATIGRGRSSAAIGMFDYDKLKQPLTYSETDTSTISFVPLGYSESKSYSEIINETEKGKMYGRLLGGKAITWKEANGKIFALPPIINGAESSVSKSTRSILIDITGKDKYAVNSITRALIYNLMFAGEVTVLKPEYATKDIDPGFEMKPVRFYLKESDVSGILNTKLTPREIVTALKALDYVIIKEGAEMLVETPFYRQDIIHQVDIIDDIMRFYGVDRLPVVKPSTYTLGRKLPVSDVIDIMRDDLVGLGYQEIDLNVLSNEDYQFRKMGIKPENYAPLMGVKSGEITMGRKNLSPEMLRFISNNLHRKFAKKLFDIGYTMELGDADVVFNNRLRMTIVSCGLDTNISEIGAVLERVTRDAIGGQKVSLRKDEKLFGFSDTFIKGRCGAVYYGDKKVGVIGEVHPRVLNEFKIELPVCLAEISLDAII